MRTLFLFFAILISSSGHTSPLVRHDVMVDGHKFALWNKNVESAKASILLLHGRTWSALPDFDLQVAGEEKSFMDGLNAKGYNVYALDQRGYGGTKRDASGWLSPDRASKDVIGIINWIRTKQGGQLFLFGWSYGSMVTQMVTQRQVSAADAIILFGYPFNPKRHIVSKRKRYPKLPPREVNTAVNAASDFIVPGAISDEAIKVYVAAALDADPVRVDFNNLHEWAELDAKQIKVPTLLIHGAADPLALTKVHVKLFSEIRTQRKWWVVLEGGDHAALLESPRQEMLGAIDGFLSPLL